MEISLPAGSFAAAIAAFRGGADSVYLGLNDYSARKKAVNFTLEQLSKLREYTRRNGGKIYVTINTVLSDAELAKLDKDLFELELLDIDGVIVQDLGVARLVRERHKSLALHASTQLACHTAGGVEFLSKLGFTRVVLARELSFAQISEIKKECPRTELKVFIHGAMCCGFSGLCEASRIITGRSGNRGECAQICRSWFSCNDTRTDGYFFSMKDLCIGEDIRKLEAIGIEAVKIEGRMKSPEYCYWAARYYRLILDNAPKPEIDSAFESLSCTFLRDNGKGFFNGARAQKQINPSFPKHMGLPAGTIAKVQKNSVLVKLAKPVALRDGLMIIGKDIKEDPLCFSLLSITDRSGHRKSYANSGETVEIPLPAGATVTEGQEVRLISLHNATLETHRLDGAQYYRKPVDISVKVYPQSISLSATVFGNSFSLRNGGTVQPATGNSDFRQIFSNILKSSGDSVFTADNIDFEFNTAFENPFVPLSVLKAARRDWYAYLERKTSEFIEKSDYKPQCGEYSLNKLPERKLLGLWDCEVEIGGVRYLPLCPVVKDEKTLYGKLDATLKNNPDTVFGLNNVSHINWAVSHPEAKVFCDIYTYIANFETLNEITQLLPNLIGAYSFMEDEKSFSPLLTHPGKDYKPPLFISLCCFKADSLNRSCEICKTGKTVYTLTQNGRKYNVSTKDCLTVVTEAE